MRWLTLSNRWSLVRTWKKKLNWESHTQSMHFLSISDVTPHRLTTPSGSTRSRCLGWPPCCPVRTYCPGVVPDSRTRKSPSRISSRSASFRLKPPWNQASHCNCCTRVGAAEAELWPLCPETPRASSKGSVNTQKYRWFLGIFLYVCRRKKNKPKQQNNLFVLSFHKNIADPHDSQVLHRK